MQQASAKAVRGDLEAARRLAEEQGARALAARLMTEKQEHEPDPAAGERAQ
jgi:hypothetical protein